MGYPALQQAADSASLLGQRRFTRVLAVRLAGLLVAAFGGGILVSSGLIGVGGWVALLGFLAAIVAEWYTVATQPDRAWYEGRAAAESAKTLAWRYCVRGDSFDGKDEQEVDREFVRRIREILLDLQNVDLNGASSSEQITPKMREIRAAPFDRRRAMYREGRVEDQRAWYESKAHASQSAGSRWGAAVFLAEGLGVLGGVALISGAFVVDLLGFFAATAAGVTAWTQAKQYRTLGTAYGVASQELAAVKSELDALQNESDWARFVGEAEEAISREHTLWRASRGLKVSRRRGPWI